ncbi:sigma-54 interaction domain-containing protein [Candidatus Poribacteria bacterium]
MNKLDEESEGNIRLSHFTIEHAPRAIFWVDAEGRIHRVNESACRLLGYARDELTSMKAYELYNRKDDELWRKRWLEPDESKAFTFEDYMFRKDGQSIPVEVTRNFIEFEGREYTCSFVRDMTEHKRKEEALRGALGEVEQLKNRLQEENLYLQDEIKLTHNFEEIICQSDELRGVLERVEQVASTDATVLVLGETGTGKELIARAVHSISPRGDRPLVKVNCAALQENLIESELFGHERGAYTGAHARRSGRFELANGGTVFLDEIGDLSVGLQSKLLRVLQEGQFERLGSSHTTKVDVRVIAATNRDLEKALAEKSFREDLYYRLNVFPIRIPPLRERKDDIPLLVEHFIRKYSIKMGKQIEEIPRRAMDSLQAYHWPGNVRELENVVERAVIISQGRRLELREWSSRQDVPSETSGLVTMEEVERAYIIKVLESTRWRVSGEKGAAEILGLNPQTLFSRMRRLGINRKDDLI